VGDAVSRGGSLAAASGKEELRLDRKLTKIALSAA
jgi:hypothetical protein